MKSFLFAILVVLVSVPCLSQTNTRDLYGDSTRATTSWQSLYTGGAFEKIVEIIADTTGSTQTLYIYCGSRADSTANKTAKKISNMKLKYFGATGLCKVIFFADEDSVTFKTSGASVMVHVNSYSPQTRYR